MSNVSIWMETASCPECGEIGTICKILWGMPTEQAFESGDFVIGGCMVQGEGLDPKIGCLSCSWTGNYKNRKLISSPPQSDI